MDAIYKKFSKTLCNGSILTERALKSLARTLRDASLRSA